MTVKEIMFVLQTRLDLGEIQDSTKVEFVSVVNNSIQEFKYASFKDGKCQFSDVSLDDK